METNELKQEKGLGTPEVSKSYLIITEFERTLILESIENKHSKYLDFINKYFMGFSEYNSVKDLRQYEIGEEILNNAMIFTFELSDTLKEVKQIIKLIKKYEFDDYVLEQYEIIVTAINTIIRGCKEKLKTKLEILLKHMKPETIETYNNRVVSYFRYAP